MNAAQHLVALEHTVNTLLTTFGVVDIIATDM